MSTYLPVELIEKVFTRLPAKSLFRFKIVSKSCRDMIESPHFINSHLEQSSERVMVLKNADKKIYFFDMPSESCVRYDVGNYSFDCFVGSCNGFVCLLDVDGNVVICNVATRERLMIPHSSNLNAWVRCGFGYDIVGDDYKVVLIESFRGLETQIENSLSMVYSLKQNKWTTILHAPYPFGHQRGVPVNGFMHWAIHPESKGGIVAFDLHAEVFCAQVPLPERARCLIDVGASKGCLLMTEQNPRELGSLCDELGVWMMKDYMIKDSWTKLYSVGQIYIPCQMSNHIPLIPLSSGCMFWQRYKRKKGSKIQIYGRWVQLADSIVYGESLIKISAYAGLPGATGEPTIEVNGMRKFAQ